MSLIRSDTPRVGVDIVALSRAQDLTQPDRAIALARMLTTEEINSCTRGEALDTPAVAGILAIKEAVFKLFHVTERAVPWRSIRVTGGAGMWPEVSLEGAAAHMAQSAGLASPISVSLSHDGAYAIAVAAAIQSNKE